MSRRRPQPRLVRLVRLVSWPPRKISVVSHSTHTSVSCAFRHGVQPSRRTWRAQICAISVRAFSLGMSVRGGGSEEQWWDENEGRGAHAPAALYQLRWWGWPW